MNAVVAEHVRRCRDAQPAWAALSVRDRLRPVRAFRQLLAAEATALCDAIRRDLGRPPFEVIATDLTPTADACRFLERRAASILRPRTVSLWDRPVWLWGERDVIHRRPHGVVAVIGTWNYPVFLNGIQLMQALTAGNAVVWKPSEVAPKTAAALTALLEKAGFPPGLIGVLPATREGGPELAEAEVDHVVFTGSAEVGRKLARRLGERLVGSTLELSGCDALFVLRDADVPMAAKAAWYGTTLNRGQTCLAVRRVFVDRTRYPEFIAALTPLAEIGVPLPLALEAQAQQASRLVEEAIAAGARAVTSRLPVDPSGPAFLPTVLFDAAPGMAVCREASFAPLMAVMPFDSVETALAMDRECPFSLGASVFTADRHQAAALAERLTVGLLVVNDVIVSAAHPATPFGGRRASGWGVTQGADGLLGMTVPQVVSRKSGRFRPHYDLDQFDPAAVEAVMRAMLDWRHAATFGGRLGGLWRLLSNGRRLMRKRS